ncbi:MAG: tRNA 2-thiouridine(34) synthase MnmA [Firmicutes bacterium]|nr:tRNA 2-thiouridine(34) synthase MnmA [Bacillota bacterium]
MSGGVDSSVAAALLREQGYDVVGVTMQIWPDVAEDEAYSHGGCCSVTAAHDARRVAAVLGIPHYVLNFKEVFAGRVISNFCAEYESGRTPNPCLICNRDIKFGELLGKARELGASFVATGHYARVVTDPSTGRRLLLKGVDRGKDQSYALYMLSQEQLAAAMFPLGGMRKTEVRRLAARLGLPTADKPESQEICFVTSGDYREFLESRHPRVATPGPIVDRSGNVLGTHRGLAFYTVGQRRGLGIAKEIPLYVIDIDPARNALVVGTAGEAMSSEFAVYQANFIPFDSLTGPLDVRCKIRYRAAEAPATIEPIDSVAWSSSPGGRLTQNRRARVRLHEPQRAITPGQSAVFYDGEVVVGGGIIERAMLPDVHVLRIM